MAKFGMRFKVLWKGNLTRVLKYVCAIFKNYGIKLKIIILHCNLSENLYKCLIFCFVFYISRIRMSCRQILRRLTPVFRCTSTLVPSINNSINCLNRHFVIRQNLAKNLTGSRYFSSTVDPQIINIQDEDDFMKRVIEASTKSPIVVDFHAQ